MARSAVTGAGPPGHGRRSWCVGRGVSRVLAMPGRLLTVTALDLILFARCPAVPARDCRFRHAPISRPDGTRPRRRRGKARPHRHRHAVGVRPSDAVRSRARLSARHHQEAAPQIDHPRAVVVPGRRHQRQIPAGITASRSGTTGRTSAATSAPSTAGNGVPGRRGTAAPSTRSPMWSRRSAATRIRAASS